MRKNSIITMLLFSFTHVMLGQETIRIDLQTILEIKSGSFSTYIDFESKKDSISNNGMAPGGIHVIKTKLTHDTYALQFAEAEVTSKETSKTYLIKMDSSIVVWVERHLPTGNRNLPYIVKLDHIKNREGIETEIFRWTPNYLAEGLFRHDGCESTISISDVNGDGKYENEDFAWGTSIHIDADNDGRYYGEKEHLFRDQIIEYCDKHFVIDSIAVDGSFITLSESNLPILKTGDIVPQFVEQTIDGETISPETLLGTNYLFDFWASWCVVCIQKFPEVQQLDKELNDELKIIAVNVDTKSYIPKAMKTIEKYELTWPHIMNGKGKQDPLWRVFGSNTDFRFSIPLYVLVDKNGKIAYIGHGGNELVDLRNSIQTILPESTY